MANLYGEVPSSPVIFAACDKLYFEEHGPSFIYSCNDIGKDVHIHISDPEEKHLNIANILNYDTDISITYSFSDFENMGQGQRTYYACLRFLVLPFILPFAQKVLTVDIDCIFLKDFEFPKKPTGYFAREPFENSTGWFREGTRVAAGVVYMDVVALPLAKVLAERIKKGPWQWYLDQVALSECFDLIESDSVHHFSNEFMDWHFHGHSVMWTGKGPRKYENQRYIDRKNLLNRFSGAVERSWK